MQDRFLLSSSSIVFRLVLPTSSDRLRKSILGLNNSASAQMQSQFGCPLWEKSYLFQSTFQVEPLMQNKKRRTGWVGVVAIWNFWSDQILEMFIIQKTSHFWFIHFRVGSWKKSPPHTLIMLIGNKTWEKMGCCLIS